MLHRDTVTPASNRITEKTIKTIINSKFLMTNTMNKSQIRFAMAAHAAWLVMKNPVLTRVYMTQWESLYPRPLSVEGTELSLYGYVFNVMYEAV